MSQSQVTRRLATAGAMSFLAACTTTAQPPAPPPEPQATIYPVSFPPGSIQLHTADQETIHGVAAMMERNPALVATVVGKADTVGSVEYNEKLSQRRAQAVFDALVYTYKMPATRVGLRWTGERELVVPTGENKAELQNRVVNIILR